MNGLAEIDLLCLGEPMVEFNAQPDERWLYGFGGDVSNVAVAAARQSAKVGILTRIGADSFGDDLMRLWTEEGVDTTYAERDVDAPTGLYFVRHGAEGHTFEYRPVGFHPRVCLTKRSAQPVVSIILVSPKRSAKPRLPHVTPPLIRHARRVLSSRMIRTCGFSSGRWTMRVK